MSVILRLTLRRTQLQANAVDHRSGDGMFSDPRHIHVPLKTEYENKKRKEAPHSEAVREQNAVTRETGSPKQPRRTAEDLEVKTHLTPATALLNEHLHNLPLEFGGSEV